jgi:hypothetical protein
MPVACVAVAVLALFVSSAALVVGSGGDGDMTTTLAELNDSLVALDGRVAALKAEVAAAPEVPDEMSTTLSGLRARVAKSETEAARLGRAVVEIPEPAAAAAGIDPVKLREIVQKEMPAIREQMGRERADRGRREATARIREGFGLNEEKAEKVYAVQRKAFGEMGRLWRENRGDRNAMRKAMEGLWDGAEKEMAEFLSEEELAKVHKWREQMAQRMRDRGNQGGGRGRPQEREKPREEPRPQGRDDPEPF